MKVKLSILNEILWKCMSKDQVWKVIFFFHTDRPKPFLQTGKWPNLLPYFSRLRGNPVYLKFSAKRRKACVIEHQFCPILYQSRHLNNDQSEGLVISLWRSQHFYTKISHFYQNRKNWQLQTYSHEQHISTANSWTFDVCLTSITCNRQYSNH